MATMLRNNQNLHKDYFKADLAGLPFCYSFCKEKTTRYFDMFSEAESAEALDEPDLILEVTEQQITDAITESGLHCSDAYMECQLLMPLTSTELLKKDACIFHGAAFTWKEKAWIFTAPSGTGKSTQLGLWEQQFGDEIKVINGDKPAVRYENGRMMVYPSPWLGKEGYGTKDPSMKAELGGIIYLQQAKENTITRLSARQAAPVIFLQFLALNETEEEIHRTCRLEEKMLSAVPVWLLRNRGDEESAVMMHEILEQYSEAVNE